MLDEAFKITKQFAEHELFSSVGQEQQEDIGEMFINAADLAEGLLYGLQPTLWTQYSSRHTALLTDFEFAMSGVFRTWMPGVGREQVMSLGYQLFEAREHI